MDKPSAISPPETDERTDGQLLAEFLASGSQQGFQRLIDRHGRMVLGACRRLLGETQDAEDAAQAVFILLWKKAGGLTRRASAAGWLHHVARHVCRNALRARAARRSHEREGAAMGEQMRHRTDQWRAVREVLDEELDRLPEKYRLPLILFHLEDRSLAEIGVLLGANSSTVGTWLSRARELLASRLRRRGLTFSAAALAGGLTDHAGAGTLPATFASATTQAAGALAAGNAAAAASQGSAQVFAFTKGALPMLTMAKLKLAALAAVFTAAVIGGVTLIVLQALAMSPEQKKEIELLQGTWVVVAQEADGQSRPESQFKPFNDWMLFEGTTLRRRQTAPDGKDVGEEVRYTVDPTKSPKTIDLTQFGRTAFGVYELSGDTLKLCVSNNAAPRPTGFTTSRGDRCRLDVLQRAK